LKPVTRRRAEPQLEVRPATLDDVGALESFIAAYTSDGTLLPRPRANLLHHVRDFRVVCDGGLLIGCGALQVVNTRLAEVRSVAVHPDWRGGGIGSRIVECLLGDAHALRLGRVFCLTRRQSFFARLGFVTVSKETFPHKIWNDCRLCPRRESCDEIAMVRFLPDVVRTASQVSP
jgi:amino-acid N-acetyltransferase